MAIGRRKTMSWLVGGLLVVAIGAVALLRTRTAWELSCTALRRELPAILGVEVGINSCQIDPLTQTLTLGGVSLFSPGHDEPLLVADQVQASLRAVGPGTIELERLSVSRPRVQVDASAGFGAVGADRSGECRLDGLRRARIHRFEVKDGEVSVRLPQGRSVTVSGVELGWRLRRNVVDLELEARQGTLRWDRERELAIGRIAAEGALDLQDESLELVRSDLSIDASTVSASGKIETLCTPALDLDGQVFFPLVSLARLAETRETVGGHVWARVALKGPVERLVASIEAAGNGLVWGRFAPGDFSASATLTESELVVQSLRTGAGAGTLRASGSLKLVKGLPLKAKVELDNAQFGPILQRSGLPGSWVDFLATGRASLAGPLLPEPNLLGEGDIRLGRFVVERHGYDRPRPPNAPPPFLQFAQGRLITKLAVLGDRVELRDARASSGQSEATADAALYYDPNRGMEIRGVAETLNFSDFGHVAGITWSGQGSGRFDVVGPYADSSIESTVSVRDFVFWDMALGVAQARIAFRHPVLSFPVVHGQKARTQYTGRGEMRFLDEGPRTLAHVEIARGGRAEDLIEVLAPMAPKFWAPLREQALAGEVSGTLDLDSPPGKLVGAARLDYRGLTYYGRRLGDGPMSVRFVDGTSLVLDPFVLEGPLGVTRVDGTWAYAGPLDYRVSVERASLAELVGAANAKSLGIGGLLTLAGKVSGDSDMPVVSAYVTSPQVTFASRGLGAMHLEARLQGIDLQVWGRPFADGRVNGSLRLKEPFPWEGSVAVLLPEIRPLLPEKAANQGLSGSLGGTLTASGNFRDVSAIGAHAQIDRLSLSRGDFAGANEGPVVLSWADGKLQIESFLFKGPNTELAAAGYWGTRVVDLRAHGALDMRLLESFLPEIERSGGRVELTAAISGASAAPAIAGNAELFDARLSVRDQPFNLRSVSGRVEFSEARVLFQDVSGVLNDGRINLRGDVRLAGFDLKQLEVGMDLDEVTVRVQDNLPVTASGSLLLYGRPGALQLAGGLDIVKLHYDQPVALEAFLKDVRGGRAPGTEKPKEWLRFDVDVAATGDVKIDNNLARARLAGKVKLSGTNLRPGLIGVIEATEGSQAFYRGNQFAVTKAEVQFKEASSIDGLLELNAQAQVREYLVNLKAFGRLSDPRVLLTSEPALAEADILSLLTLGVTSRDRTVTAGAGAGLAAEALLSASGLDRQVQRFLPKGAFLRDFQVHLSTTYNSASGQVEPAWSLESKLLTEQLKLGMTQPVSGKGTRAQAEYRFNDRVSARAQWDNENQDFSFGNPGLDLKLRFDWE